MNLLFKNIKPFSLLMILAIGGCASIMMGSYQDILIETKCGEKLVRSECSVTNEKGDWFVRVPGTVNIHKGFDELEITCKSDEFELHKVSIKSNSTLPLLGNVVIGGGVGVIVDLETKAGFEYPTRITFKVNSCKSLGSSNLTPVLTKNEISESKNDKRSSKEQSTAIKPESSEEKPIQYCRQMNSNIPGCLFK
jgi:hypothetical protein